MAEPKKIVLITGANQGLGFEAARIFATHEGYHILIGSRTLSKGEDAARTISSNPATKSSVSALQIDVTDDLSITRAALQVATEHDRLDVLINNAGIARDPQNLARGDSVRANLRDHYETNVFGAAQVFETFVPLLLKAAPSSSVGPSAVFLTSELGSMTPLADPESPFRQFVDIPDILGYRSSKSALNMCVLEYSRKFGPRGVKVWGVCPGFRATGLSGDLERVKAAGAEAPEDGGMVVVKSILDREGMKAGCVMNERGVVPF